MTIALGYQDRLARLAALDPHELLGVSRDAAADAVRRAYWEKARLYHPDRLHPFMAKYGEEILKLLNDAYARLRNGATS